MKLKFINFNFTAIYTETKRLKGLIKQHATKIRREVEEYILKFLTSTLVASK
jgi:hypothetical protein